MPQQGVQEVGHARSAPPQVVEHLLVVVQDEHGLAAQGRQVLGQGRAQGGGGHRAGEAQQAQGGPPGAGAAGAGRPPGGRRSAAASSRSSRVTQAAGRGAGPAASHWPSRVVLPQPAGPLSSTSGASGPAVEARPAGGAGRRRPRPGGGCSSLSAAPPDRLWVLCGRAAGRGSHPLPQRALAVQGDPGPRPALALRPAPRLIPTSARPPRPPPQAARLRRGRAARSPRPRASAPPRPRVWPPGGARPARRCQQHVHGALLGVGPAQRVEAQVAQRPLERLEVGRLEPASLRRARARKTTPAGGAARSAAPGRARSRGLTASTA